jgi:O-antigen/teichoic acid export membrane protein
LFFFAGIALFLVAPWAISKLNGPFFAESIMTAQILIVFIFFDQIYSLFDQYLKVLKNSAVPFFYFARVIIFLSVVYACSIRSPLGVAMARLVETIVSLTLIAIFITKHRFKITIFKTSNLFNWAARSPQTPE